jgi:hypothetical protein
LIIFPEGTTNRTNDRLKPLLDGVAFIARTAARRRAKRHREPGTLSGGSGEVVVQPVAIKYLCVEPIERWAHAQLDDFERRLGWKLMPAGEVRERTVRLAEAQLALKEVQYLGGSQSGNLPQRRDALIEHLLTRTEQALGLKRPSDDVRERVRQLRAVASARYFENHPDPQLETELRQHVQAADLAQDLLAYPDQYLEAGQATDTRVVETIQRMQETILGKADHSIPLKAVVEFAPAIPVTTKRPPRGERDPLMQQLEERLTEMIAGLATEARPL